MADDGRTTLITGGAGFIGQRVAAALVESGRRVRALDALNPQVHRRPDDAVARFPGEVIVADVRDPAAVADAMDGCTAVVHLAAETGVGQSMYETERYRTVNVDGTRIVLAAALERGARVVVASSRAVYGPGAWECPQHGRTIGTGCCPDGRPSASREDDPLAPVSVYGETKVDGERLATEAAGRGLDVVVVRPQNVIGAGQALHNPYTGVLAAFAARLRSGLPPQVYGMGSQTRDFVSVEDVTSAILWLLDRETMWEGAPMLNLGTGVRVTLRDLATSACRAAGAPTELEFVDVTRPGDIDHACADLTRARALGLPEPVVPFDDSVRAFLDYAAADEPVDPAIWDAALTQLAAVDDGE